MIILDEPTVGLDPIQIIEIRDLIRQLGQEHTVIFSSHILSEVQAICEKVLIIAKGKLVAFDEPDNLEKLLTASGAVSFITEADEKEVREILEGMELAADWQLREQEDGSVQGEIQTEAGEMSHICRQLFFAFARREKALLQLAPKKANLEDVFIELTEGDSGKPEAEEGKTAERDTEEKNDEERLVEES